MTTPIRRAVVKERPAETSVQALLRPAQSPLDALRATPGLGALRQSAASLALRAALNPLRESHALTRALIAPTAIPGALRPARRELRPGKMPAPRLVRHHTVMPTFGKPRPRRGSYVVSVATLCEAHEWSGGQLWGPGEGWDFDDAANAKAAYDHEYNDYCPLGMEASEVPDACGGHPLVGNRYNPGDSPYDFDEEAEWRFDQCTPRGQAEQWWNERVVPVLLDGFDYVEEHLEQLLVTPEGSTEILPMLRLAGLEIPNGFYSNEGLAELVVVNFENDEALRIAARQRLTIDVALMSRGGWRGPGRSLTYLDELPFGRELHAVMDEAEQHEYRWFDTQEVQYFVFDRLHPGTTTAAGWAELRECYLIQEVVLVDGIEAHTPFITGWRELQMVPCDENGNEQ